MFPDKNNNSLMTKALLIKMSLWWRDWTGSHRREQNRLGLECMNQNTKVCVWKGGVEGDISLLLQVTMALWPQRREPFTGTAKGKQGREELGVGEWGHWDFRRNARPLTEFTRSRTLWVKWPGMALKTLSSNVPLKKERKKEKVCVPL